MEVMHYISAAKAEQRKLFAWLVDPEKAESSGQWLVGSGQWSVVSGQRADSEAVELPNMLIFVGGSSGGEQTEKVVKQLKAQYDVPVVLFPGNVRQVTSEADALLFLSLLSGRNAEMLVGQQVRAAEAVRQAGIETIPMGYILVNGGIESAVARVSGTQPIAQEAVDEIVQTAMAAEMMGKQLVYLEAGSGALEPVRAEVIRAVRAAISCPLIVGGGIRSTETMQRAFNAGADIVVVGNWLEEHPEALEEFKTLSNSPLKGENKTPSISPLKGENKTPSISPLKGENQKSPFKGDLEGQDDARYMGMALREAEKAFEAGEVPVGCVVVSQGQVIGRGHNLTETLQDVTAHAEMQALTAAAQTVGGKYLQDATLYVTVEPCVMCAGAIGWAQVKRVVYGCADEKRGFTRFAPKALHAKATVVSGVCEEECRTLMQAFFRKKRG